MHDAYDYWTLAVNACVAAGTLGAVIVALWLGVSARSADAKREERRERAGRRQVAVVVRRSSDIGPLKPDFWVDVVNDSPDLVSNVIIEITADTERPVEFRWGEEGPPPYVTSEGSYRGTGTFRLVAADGEVVQNPFVRPARENIHTMLAWQDSHGQWWARRDGGEPYETDAAKPGRDTAAFAQGASTRREQLLRMFRLKH